MWMGFLDKDLYKKSSFWFGFKITENQWIVLEEKLFNKLHLWNNIDSEVCKSQSISNYSPLISIDKIDHPYLAICYSEKYSLPSKSCL